jgi:hypothetical protein
MLVGVDPILWKILPAYAGAIAVHCHYWHLYLSGCYSLRLFQFKNVSCELNHSNGLSAAEAQAETTLAFTLNCVYYPNVIKTNFTLYIFQATIVIFIQNQNQLVATSWF